ncbi:MAG: formimidoylglutamate deiminase [Alphaproteobacteria bacterium]|nr:formimidoylglutamate deiminase [Alphaproteobacteria bacterium]MDE2042111.1 formimidoylglutamate deiminase [Alphaproteobacteria bacterium]MDE2340133.1 formimidoylglutamate deiminase [Alphaproteobacteria bacterium]
MQEGLSFHFERALLPTGWAYNVRAQVAGGWFARVTTETPAQPADQRFELAVPGMMNLHSHAFQYAMAGAAEVAGPGADSFWTWREAMYGLAASLDPDAFEAVAVRAFRAMLAAGYTRVGEFHYLHNAPNGTPYADPAEMSLRLIAAARTAGISLTLLPVLYQRGGFDGRPLDERQARFALSVDDYAALFSRLKAMEDDALTVGLAAHSLRAVAPEALAALTTLDTTSPIHIHIAEQQAEVADCVAATGQRPVDWLYDHSPVDARWCLVHATHVNDAELARIAQSSAVVGLCPITEANLGDGIFPARAYVDAGGRFGIGSDSNIEIDSAAELRLLEYGQRLVQQQRNVMSQGPQRSTASDLYMQVLAGGAQALGQALAGIRAGAPADFVTLYMSALDAPNALDRLVFAPRHGVKIDTVWTRGVQRITGGE